MAENYPNGKKTLWEKDKLLVTSKLSFSHSVFKRFVLQTCKNQGLFGKELNKSRLREKCRQNGIEITKDRKTDLGSYTETGKTCFFFPFIYRRVALLSAPPLQKTVSCYGR